MACDPELLRDVPLFARLDDDERRVLAAQVELKRFAARERIYAAGTQSRAAYVVVEGKVHVTVVDEDGQDVVLNEVACGEFFGLASMLEQINHQSTASAVDATACIELDRNDIMKLLEVKPHAGLDMMSVLARHVHNAQQLIRHRSMRNVNDVIEEQATLGEQIADQVARFGGSWAFIITFAIVLIGYSTTNVLLKQRAWDPYPFILLNLFLSMLAAIQAPVIMMSQNRQDKKDRMRSECDFEVNRRAEAEIQGLARKLHLLADKIDDIEDLLTGRAGHPGPPEA